MYRDPTSQALVGGVRALLGVFGLQNADFGQCACEFWGESIIGFAAFGEVDGGVFWLEVAPALKGALERRGGACDFWIKYKRAAADTISADHFFKAEPLSLRVLNNRIEK